jgi:PleD family two-component response regulator
VDDQEWSARALETVLGAAGISVVRAPSGRHALAAVRAVAPDAVMVRGGTGGLPAAEVVRCLRGEAAVGAGTPVVAMVVAPLVRAERLELLRAGAWEVLATPVDAEELVARMHVFLAAKREADRAREESLVDSATGLYSPAGLVRRMREMGMGALRRHEPLGCVVIAADDPEGDPEDPPWNGDEVARRVAAAVRGSDAAGRLGRTQMVVLAPCTGPTGTLAVARRLLAALEGLPRGRNGEAPRIRAGCFAVDDFAQAALEPVEMLVRATTAALQPGARHPIAFFNEPSPAS